MESFLMNLKRLFVCLIFITFMLIYLIKRRYSYWEYLHIPYVKPSFPFGNIGRRKTRKHMGLVFQDHYNKLKGAGPFCGFYMFLTPTAFALDLEFIKTILVKDFEYFANRGLYHNQKNDPLTGNLLRIDGEKWRDLRKKLTPTFSSSKMKFMFPSFIKVANELKVCLEKETQNSKEINMKEVLSRFSTDIIGTCAFGIMCNTLKDPKAIFREMGRQVANPINSLIKNLFMMNYPDLARKMRMTVTRKDVSDFFLNVVKDTVHYREENHMRLNDFMTILIDLKNSGELTLEELGGQAFIFFLAGFETSSTAMFYAIYELSVNLAIQEKARAEVLAVSKKYDGVFTYEAIRELKYVEQIIYESLRKYPPITNIVRKVTKTYRYSKTDTIFPKHSTVFVPVYAIHHDPQYYPDPEQFKPDRFTEDEIQKRNPYAFLPFGAGPRNCIGLRFGMLQSIIGLSTILQHFKFKLSPTVELPFKFKKDIFILTADRDLLFNIESVQ